jgi:type II secretory pathway pseudopilin PulG
VIELTITLMLLLIVVGSLLTVFESVQRTQVFAQERSQTLDDMRIAIERVTKEARQATSVTSTSDADTLDMETYINGTSTHVVYATSGDDLTRTVGSSTVTILTNLDSTSIFAYTPSAESAQVITITLDVHPARRPDTVLSLTSEVRLRNEGTS